MENRDAITINRGKFALRRFGVPAQTPDASTDLVVGKAKTRLRPKEAKKKAESALKHGSNRIRSVR